MASKHLKRVHGEGSIRYRKDKDLWEARYTTGFDKEGKQIQKSVYGKSPEEVREKLTKTLVKIDEGSYIEPSKMPLGDWLENWLFNFKQSTLKPTTFGTYEQNIRNHIKPYLGHIPLKDLKLDAIQELYNNQLKKGRCDGECEQLSTASVIKIHTILSQALDKAVEKEMIYKNPAKFAELPPLVEKPSRVLTMDEQIKFMQVVKQHRMRAATLTIINFIHIALEVITKCVAYASSISETPDLLKRKGIFLPFVPHLLYAVQEGLRLLRRAYVLISFIIKDNLFRLVLQTFSRYGTRPCRQFVKILD